MRLAFLVTALALYQGAPSSQLDWAAAERNIVRLKPSRFPLLPVEVRRYLEKRACAIPQAVDIDEQPNNVIRGRFTSATQQDIAVLCSVEGTSTILVFRGGSANNVAELGSGADKGVLQTTGPRTIGFSRAIGVAKPSDIRANYKESGGPKPPPHLDHDGIEDAFVGKASMAFYWFGGKWLTLAGTD